MCVCALALAPALVCVVAGLSWSGFRPSDDQQAYPYNIPVNMYAAGALKRLAALNEVVWQDADIAELTKVIGDGIKQGVEKHGIVSDE